MPQLSWKQTFQVKRWSLVSRMKRIWNHFHLKHNKEPSSSKRRKKYSFSHFPIFLFSFSFLLSPFTSICLFNSLKPQLRLELDTKRGLIENAQFNENDVFISYCWADCDLVRMTAAKIVASTLSADSTSSSSPAQNIQIWIDTEKMRGNIYNAMEEGVRLTKVFVSFISPKYAASANCQRELKLANDLRKKIVCCIVDPASRFENGGWPPPGIGTLVAGNLYLDLTKNFDQSFQELLSKIRESASSTPLALATPKPASTPVPASTTSTPIPSETNQETNGVPIALGF